MTLKIIFRSMVFGLTFIHHSCSVNPWDLPENLTVPFVRPPEEHLISIRDLLSLYEQQLALDGNPILDLNAHASKFLTGYVISSDAWGNYYKELVIQDKPQSPSSGVRVLIDHTSLSDRFTPGNQIYISLQGLDFGLNQQMFTLGIEDGGQIKALTLDPEFGTRILRDTLTFDLMPRMVSLETLTPSHMNQWIQIDDVQFHRSQVMGPEPATFAAGSQDRYDGNRLLESCSGSSQLILQTSVFAEFQTQKLPQGRGFVQGILQYDYYGEYPVLVINNRSDLMMDSPQRCDPDLLQCTLPNLNYRMFERFNFESTQDLEHLIEQGWRVTSNTTNSMWEFGNYAGNRYLFIDGRDSPIDTLKTKLISPVFNMPAQVEELTLELDLQVNFAQGVPLSLYLGALDGDQIQWTLMDYVMPTGPSNGYGDFKTIGPISLSCAGPNFVLGLYYEQLSQYDKTRYHIDNIELRVWP